MCRLVRARNVLLTNVFWSDKDQNRTLTFYATTAINFHTAALSEYKIARLAFPTPEKAESANIVGLIRVMDGLDIVGDLALIHGDDGSTSVGLWIKGAQQKSQSPGDASVR